MVRESFKAVLKAMKKRNQSEAERLLRRLGVKVIGDFALRQ